MARDCPLHTLTDDQIEQIAAIVLDEFGSGLSRPQSVELAVARVAERVRRGGHAVRESTVRRRYDRSLANFFALYSRFADSWLMLDNSIQRRPRVVALRSIGRPLRISDADGWNALRTRYEQEDSNEG